jgi:RNA polymerase sigma-70 factor (ECF subfamily)
MTEFDIIQGLKEKDPTAFDEVYARLYKKMCAFAASLVYDPAESEDQATDGFVKLWKHHKDFSSLRHIETFLVLTIKHSCIDLIRKNRHRVKYLEDAINQGSIGDDEIERKYQKADIINRIYNRIEQLPEGQRNCFKLTYLEGHSSNEVAQILNLSEKTVRNQNWLALKTLRLALNNLDSNDKPEETLMILFLLTIITSQ